MNWGLQDRRQLAGAAVWECLHSNGQVARGKSIAQLCHEAPVSSSSGSGPVGDLLANGRGKG